MQGLNPSDAYTFGALNALFAAYILYKGVRYYTKYRYLEDTPQSTARALAVGFVRLEGHPAGEERLVSPVHHVPCFYYAVRILTIEDSMGGAADRFKRREVLPSGRYREGPR